MFLSGIQTKLILIYGFPTTFGSPRYEGTKAFGNDMNMKIVLQRVSQACVTVNGRVTGQIASGMLILFAVGKGDDESKAERLVEKIIQLRIFNDVDGKMNCSITDVNGAFLVVSQFTLYGDCQKGRRPSFDAAADPADAERIYNYFVECLRRPGFRVETGVFRAKMDVSLTNDGPVTFVLEM